MHFNRYLQLISGLLRTESLDKAIATMHLRHAVLMVLMHQCFGKISIVIGNKIWFELWAIILNRWLGLGLEEYCLFETFHAECPNNKVIMLTEAKYGRMRIGRCVKSDLGKSLFKTTLYVCVTQKHIPHKGVDKKFLYIMNIQKWSWLLKIDHLY